MTFDAEDLLDSVIQIVKAGMATKCAAIEAEKAAKGKATRGGLPAPDTAKSYHEQTWSNKVYQRTPAIFYGIEDVQSEGVGPATKVTYRVFVEIITVDGGSDTDGPKRVHRYSRAIKEVLEEGFASVAETGRIKIETVRPVSFRVEEDSSEEIRAGGVSVTVAIA